MQALNNPFAILTAVVAPAILTNACSVLSLGTSNRVARVVDRTRVVIAARAALPPDSAEYRGYSQQLQRLERRGNLLIQGLRLFYAALGAFAGSALIATAGSVLAMFELETAAYGAGVVGFATGSFGVLALVWGCSLVVQETRFAIRAMADETELALHGHDRREIL